VKKTYNITLKTIAGKTFKFQWNINTNEIMKETTVEDVFLALPYIVVSESGLKKCLVPQRSIDHVILNEQE
jgi:hypothetical protein